MKKKKSTKFLRKIPKEDKIWKEKKRKGMIPNKLIIIKRISIKFERLKNHRKWNCETFII
jgi:hypothetical protein